MPNGDEVQSTKYNPAWCQEKHKRIDEELESVWTKLGKQDRLMWSMVITLVGNLGGIIAILLVSLSKAVGI